jgi:antitoxin (DNA-binding transcriptional repressor) of toxin-antitoxin stability system
MTQITLTEAQLHLSELIAKLQPGEAVKICQDDVMASIGFTFTMK